MQLVQVHSVEYHKHTTTQAVPHAELHGLKYGSSPTPPVNNDHNLIVLGKETRIKKKSTKNTNFQNTNHIANHGVHGSKCTFQDIQVHSFVLWQS